MIRLVPFFLPLVFVIICSQFLNAQVMNGLHVTMVQKPPQANVVASYDGHDKGGNTSVAFDAENLYKWSGESSVRAEGWGYFKQDGTEVPYIKRDRDLGQTFLCEGTKMVTLRSITVMTGFGSNVVRPGMYGKKISVQIFEVSGDPVLDENGSPRNVEAFHGFPHDRVGDSIPHVRDDFFRGEVYTTLAVFRGATFPTRSEFGFRDTTASIAPADTLLKGRYLKFPRFGSC